MRTLAMSLLVAIVFAPALVAQDDYPRNFRFDFGAAIGHAFHETDGTSLDGDTGGGLARVRFEGISRPGIGGGLRFEAWGSDDDLFVDEGFAAQESHSGEFYGHFTFRAGRGRFLMPMRVGLMINSYELEPTGGGPTSLEVTTVGPRFEVEPEVVFNRGSIVEVSGYGQFGLGFGYSAVEIASSSADFDSASVLWGIEFGARVRYEFAELGLAFVSRGIAMAESDTEGGTFVRGFGADFTGILFTAAVVF